MCFISRPLFVGWAKGLSSGGHIRSCSVPSGNSENIHSHTGTCNTVPSRTSELRQQTCSFPVVGVSV